MLLAYMLAVAPVAASPSVSGPSVFTNRAINTACDANPSQVATADLNCAVSEHDVTALSSLRVEIDYDWGSATAVNMAVDTSATGTVPWHTEPVGVMGSGVITMAILPMSWAVSADAAWSVPFDNITARKVRFRFWTTGGTSADKIRALRVIGR